MSLFNPSVVVIGGQLAGAETQLLAGIRELVYQRALPLATRRLQINTSQLGVRARVTGLALTTADRVFAPSGWTPRWSRNSGRKPLEGFWR